jgi:hypothetical protein
MGGQQESLLSYQQVCNISIYYLVWQYKGEMSLCNFYVVVTHLARQNYDICFRRGSGFCYICYSPTINPATALITQISFGLS